MRHRLEEIFDIFFLVINSFIGKIDPNSGASKDISTSGAIYKQLVMSELLQSFLAARKSENEIARQIQARIDTSTSGHSKTD